MSFASARTYLLGTINETASRHHPNRLDRMRALLAALGDPQIAYPTVHVGGTSGKGSTATMIAAALTASGKRTGLHTKPHLSSMTERMRIDGLAITEEGFGSILDEMRPALEQVAAEHGRPTYYETLLALSFLYFANEGVEAAVIEVGLGGELDGTNVIVPRISVITNIGLDHTDVLGDTLELIARDKAGIAKPGVPLVSDVASGAARAVIEERCAQAGAPFLSVRDSVSIEPQAGEPYGQTFAVVTPSARYQLSLPILGRFQQRNAATAILALEQLDANLRPSVEAIEKAMSLLVIPGRMEFFPSHPPVVFDIAHNGDKAQSLVDALLETFPNRRFITVVAIGDAKDGKAIVGELSRLPGSFIFTTFDTTGRRATRAQRLANIAEEFGRWGRAINEPVEAFSIARRNAAVDDLIVVTGSTFIVATLRDWWFANVSASAR